MTSFSGKRSKRQRVAIAGALNTAKLLAEKGGPERKPQRIFVDLNFCAFLLTEMSFDYTKYYDFLTPKNALTAKCNLCSASIKLTRRSKYNLTQHYKFSHKDEYCKASELKDPGDSQTKIILLDNQLKTSAPPYLKQKKITLSIIQKLIGKGGLPITITTMPWFISFMNDVDSRYECPSYTNIVKEIQRECDTMRCEMVQTLNNLTYSIAIDEWTGINGKSFIGCICTYIDFPSSQLISKMLFLQELLQGRSAREILSALKNKLDLIGLRSVPFSISTDNCSTMKKTFQSITKTDFLDYCGVDEDEQLEEVFIVEHQSKVDPLPTEFINWIRCAVHILQLCVSDGLKECRNYTRLYNAIIKCCKIAQLDHRSTKFSAHLTRRIKLKNDVRWNSTVVMIISVLENKEQIKDALLEESTPELILSSEEIELLTSLSDLLMLFLDATNDIKIKLDMIYNHRKKTTARFSGWSLRIPFAFYRKPPLRLLGIANCAKL